MTSYISAVFNNAGTLEALLQALASHDSEVILVDDCSTDGSREVARGLPCRLIALDRRSGQSRALLAGLAAARGDVCVCLDADLQDDPRDCAKLIAALQPPGSIVFAQRSGALRASSWLFKSILRALFPALPARVGLCFAIDAEARRRLLALPSQGYLLAMLGALALKTRTVPVVRRAAVTSGYTRASRLKHGVRMLMEALKLRFLSA